ncbi:hypothetical protein OAK75_02750 [Bacteriovoracales bacterium]|nr:hypothetical protein [Bacteriovoracales bacterium]
MNFLKFKIIQTREEHSLETNLVDILFNIDHIVSVKPIKIVLSDGILNGYWIRLTNGKKYKATEVPNELKSMLSETEHMEMDSEVAPQFH